MRHACFTLCLLCVLSDQICAITPLARADSVKYSKHEISIEAGWYSSLPLNKQEQGLPPQIQNIYDLEFQYWGFTIYPSTGFQTNLLYDYSFLPNFTLRSGIFTTWTTGKMESDTVTINSIPWSNWTSAFDPTIVRYESSSLWVTLPIEAGWSYKKFMAVGGIAPLIARYQNTTETNSLGNRALEIALDLTIHSGVIFRR